MFLKLSGTYVNMNAVIAITPWEAVPGLHVTELMVSHNGHTLIVEETPSQIAHAMNVQSKAELSLSQ